MKCIFSFYVTCEILWVHWVGAYEFSVNRDWRIHPKLTRRHVYAAELDKMRNQLAEEVLYKSMLYLMKVIDHHSSVFSHVI